MQEADHYLKRELYERVKTDPALLDFLQAQALDGVWYRDLEKPENEWMSRRFWEVLGYDPTEMPHDPASWQNILDSDDLNAARENLRRHCDDASHPYDQIMRYRHRAGHRVTVRCRGVAIRDEQGRAVRMLGTHHDVSDLVEAQQGAHDEAKAKSKAEAATQFQKAFLNTISHEIRTPLNSMLVTAEAMKAMEPTPEQSDMLSDMLLAGEQLQALLSQMLDLSKTESGGIDLNFQTTSTNETKDQAADTPGRSADGLPVGLRVLIADDVLLNRRSLKRLLKSLDAITFFATNGLQALDMMKTTAFDAALIDLRMPGMSGLDVVKEYRAFEAAHSIERRRVIACSAHILEDDHEQYLALGFDGILAKPIDLDGLIDSIRPR